jgi:hypothetical protein
MKIIIVSVIALVLTLSVTPAMPQEERGVVMGETVQQPEGYVGESVSSATNCGSTVRLATTNGVPTTIRHPMNTGACSWTLRCQQGATIRPLTGSLDPGFEFQSFSCGTNANQILWVTTGTTGRAVITYVP